MALLKKASPARTAMKAMKKAKRASMIARGRMAKAQVFKGRKAKTGSGLTRDCLIRNKRGKIVSKRQSAAGKRRFRSIQAWVDCVVEARKALQISGFAAVNGRSLQGKALYVKCKSLYA